MFSDNAGTLTDSVIYQGPSGIGIGTASPTFPLDLNNNAFAIGPQAAAGPPGPAGPAAPHRPQGPAGAPGALGRQGVQGPPAEPRPPRPHRPQGPH